MAPLLLDLHDDALLSITSILPPTDLASFSQCNRRSYHLIAPYLPAARLAHTYGEVEIQCFVKLLERCDKRWPHPAWLVDSIQKDPKVTRHVRRLSYSNDGWSHAEAGISTTGMIEQCNNARYIDAFSFLSEEAKLRWKLALAAGNPEVTLVVLLSLCRNLRALCFRHIPWESDDRFLRQYLEAGMPTLSIAVVEAVQEGMLHSYGITATPMFARQLTRIELVRSHPVSKVADLLLIPSLRELVGQLDNDAHFEWPAGRERDCQLERVELSATISPRNLCELVRGMPKLVQLTYIDLFNFVRFSAPELPTADAAWPINASRELCSGAYRLDEPPRKYFNHFVSWAGWVMQERGLMAGLREWYQHEMRRGMLLVGSTARVMQWTRPGSSLPLLSAR